MPPPMMSRTRLPFASAARAFCRAGCDGGSKLLEDVVAGLFRGLAQDDADLVLHRPAVARGAQAQQLLQLVVELPDGETGHAELPLEHIRG